jgi:hypothetical protein
VPANNRPRIDSLEEKGDPPFGRPLGEDVEIVPWRCVAVEGIADLKRRRQAVQESNLLVRQSRARVVDHVCRIDPLLAGCQFTITVTAQPEDTIPERTETLQGLGRLISTCDDVPTHDNRCCLRYLGKHGLERRQIAVNVTERCDQG